MPAWAERPEGSARAVVDTGRTCHSSEAERLGFAPGGPLQSSHPYPLRGALCLRRWHLLGLLPKCLVTEVPKVQLAWRQPHIRAGVRAQGPSLLLGHICPSSLQAAAERSKTVILVKNLPAGTPAAELQETFGRFGSLGRVLLPEGGVTAIVEFLEPLEARKAFRHLAYSKVGLRRSCLQRG